MTNQPANGNVYNPIVLQMLGDDAEPTFIGPEGVKWWRIDKDRPLFRVELASGVREWVALHDDGWVLYNTPNLNDLYLRLELMEARRG